mmetsp:Transcript_6601/g.22747  ORF Transcript_6601/g.22747 Transcript_6601/m.22747 type:complete len:331 (+) Transcript_6601:1868-2860(+)
MATTIRAQTISASRIKARAARMSSPALLGTSMGQASSFAGTRLRTTTSIATRRLSVYANVSARSEGLVGRLGRVVRSSWTQFILNQEDPERMIDTVVEDMTNDIIKLRQATAQVIASRKLLEVKYNQMNSIATDWQRRAELAVRKGDDNLARLALQRMKPAQTEAAALRAQLASQTEVLEKLKANSQLLESKIGEAKQKKNMLKARAQSAKASQWVNDTVSGLNTGSALAAFERMEEKVMTMEAEAEAAGELALLGANDSLEAQFAQLEFGTVDDDLMQLKGAMRKEALPPGRPLAEAIASSVERELDMLPIEDDLDRLKQRIIDQKKGI